MLSTWDEIHGALMSWAQRPDGEWRVSRPLPGPWLKDIAGRARDALMVLLGKAFAVEWV